MKSKILVSLLLIVAMMFTLVACEQPQGGCAQHVDQNNDGKCDLCQVTIEQSGNGSGSGDGDGSGSGSGSGDGDIPTGGEQVTAEAWASEFTLQNRQNYTSITNSVITNGDASETQTVTFAICQDIYYLLQAANDVVSSERYIDASSTPNKQYDKNSNDSYDVTDADSGTLALIENLKSSSQTMLVALGNEYSSATFNATDGKYYCQMDFNGMSYSCVAQFVAGKLHSLDYSGSYQMPGVGTVSSVVNITFDSTTLALPTV